MWKKILVAILIICALGAAFLFFQSKKAASPGIDLLQVKTMSVKPESIETKVDADGTVIAKEEKEIKTSSAGTVTGVHVQEGDRINMGDRVITLDDEGLLKSLDSARLTYAEAKQNYQKLYDKFESQDEEQRLKLLEAQDNVEIAKSSYEKEQISLGNQKSTAENRVQNARDQLTKLEKEFENKKILFEKGAISKKELEQSEESLQKAREEYQNTQQDLKVLVEETIPLSLKLARLKVTNAENQLKLLETSIENTKITQGELDVAQLRVESAQKNVKDLEAELKRTVTYSPMAGTIINIVVNKGDKVLEGAVVGKIANLDELIIEAWVDEIHINQVDVGQEVYITSDAFEDVLKGKVISIAPVATKQGNINRFKTEVQLDDHLGLLRPGMYVNTQIRTNFIESAITVPPLALLGDKEKYVLIFKDGKVEKREVKPGLRTLNKIEVTGLEVGEKVIIGPFPIIKNLEPGTEVIEIQNQGNENP